VYVSDDLAVFAFARLRAALATLRRVLCSNLLRYHQRLPRFGWRSAMALIRDRLDLTFAPAASGTMIPCCALYAIWMVSTVEEPTHIDVRRSWQAPM
jgi:hypothetical protein